MADAAFLRGWYVRYLRHKDMALRKIDSITETPNGARVVMKDRTIEVIVSLQLADAVPLLKDCWQTIVTLHNEDNRKALVERWPDFVAHSKLTIFFLNPFSTQESRWMVMPYTHDKVCDHGSLELGFTAMGELVEPITAEEFAKRPAC
ncbi:MAG: hypothetical protein V1735_05785 [Nanoarchaeota archaeon]